MGYRAFNPGNGVLPENENVGNKIIPIPTIQAPLRSQVLSSGKRNCEIARMDPASNSKARGVHEVRSACEASQHQLGKSERQKEGNDQNQYGKSRRKFYQNDHHYGKQYIELSSTPSDQVCRSGSKSASVAKYPEVRQKYIFDTEKIALIADFDVEDKPFGDSRKPLATIVKNRTTKRAGNIRRTRRP